MYELQSDSPDNGRHAAFKEGMGMKGWKGGVEGSEGPLICQMGVSGCYRVCKPAGCDEAEALSAFSRDGLGGLQPFLLYTLQMEGDITFCPCWTSAHTYLRSKGVMYTLYTLKNNFFFFCCDPIEKHFWFLKEPFNETFLKEPFFFSYHEEHFNNLNVFPR